MLRLFVSVTILFELVASYFLIIWSKRRRSYVRVRVDIVSCDDYIVSVSVCYFFPGEYAIRESILFPVMTIVSAYVCCFFPGYPKIDR
jgi:hypothetical protein